MIIFKCAHLKGRKGKSIQETTNINKYFKSVSDLKLPEKPTSATNGKAPSPLNNMKTSKHSDIY